MTTIEANIPCPQCRKSFSVPLDDIGPGKSRPCPNCGATIRFGGQDPGKVQQAIDQLTFPAARAKLA
jgi:hypothetical protein